MTKEGNLPKLINNVGEEFDLNDLIGQCNKDNNGEIILNKDSNGQLKDNFGRLINEKGYLIDK